MKTFSRFASRLQPLAEAAGINLKAHELESLERYYRLLERWNQRINLTSLPLADLREGTIARLLLEPLAAAQLVEDAALTWLDLGSGGGSPAIPLKIARPNLILTMVESRSRRAAFLREVVRSLGLERASVLCVRIEELPRLGYTDTVDFLTSRAVRLNAPRWRLCSTLLRPAGRFLRFGPVDASAANAAGLQVDTAVPGLQMLTRVAG